LETSVDKKKPTGRNIWTLYGGGKTGCRPQVLKAELLVANESASFVWKGGGGKVC